MSVQSRPFPLTSGSRKVATEGLDHLHWIFPSPPSGTLKVCQKQSGVIHEDLKDKRFSQMRPGQIPLSCTISNLHKLLPPLPYSSQDRLHLGPVFWDQPTFGELLVATCVCTFCSLCPQTRRHRRAVPAQTTGAPQRVGARC